jgi:small-conductance mechanosensitive channel
MTLPQILERSLYGNPLRSWLVFLAIAAAVFLLLLILRRLIGARLGVVAARTTNQVDDLLVELLLQTRSYVLLVLALVVASRSLTIPRADQFILLAAKLALLLQAALWAIAAVNFWVKGYLAKPLTSEDRAGVTMIRTIGIATKGVVWLLIGFSGLKTIGIDVTPLITGLGISGIAIALAVQNILGDLFAALAIVFDKPFDLGDPIMVDQIVGTVEHIGLKTTRLRSVSGEQVIVGNADLLKSRLRNLKRMYQRRAVFTLDLNFDTPPELLARVPAMVKEIVASQSPVKLDRSHVTTIGESAVRVETVYFVLDPDYNRYADIQQAINLEILRRFRAEGIELAFPTRTVRTIAVPAKSGSDKSDKSGSDPD